MSGILSAVLGAPFGAYVVSRIPRLYIAGLLIFFCLTRRPDPVRKMGVS